MALALCHVLGEVSLAEMDAGREEKPAAARYTLVCGEQVSYNASLHNLFNRPEL